MARGDGIKPAAAAGAAGGGAEFAPHAVEQVGHLRVLRRQRAFAHARGVGLDDADDAIHAMRRHPGTGAGAAGRGVGRGDERIGAVVDIEERALRAFKQNIRAVADLFVQQDDGVLHERLQVFARLIVFRKYRLERKRFGAERFEDDVVFLDAGGKFGFEFDRINQVADAQADAGGLVAVSGADAALGGADLVFALEHFAGAVQLAMIREHDVRRLAEHKILRRDLDAVFLEAFHFADEADGVEHDAVADDAQLVFAQDAGRDKVKHGLLAIDDDGVTGVVAAGVADDDFRRLGEDVDDFAFAFVAPLGTDQNCVGHKF